MVAGREGKDCLVRRDGEDGGWRAGHVGEMVLVGRSKLVVMLV